MTSPVRIPADVDREDTLIGDLTARQLIILAATATVVYLLWTLTSRALPAWIPAWADLPPLTRLLLFAAAGAPVALCGIALSLGRRDGISLDRLLIAAARQRRATPTLRPRPRTTAPYLSATHDPDSVESESLAGAGRRRGRPVVPWVPARAVRPSMVNPRVGVVELGRDGLALLCAVTPISLTLRSPVEQDQLVAGLGRWLHSLTRPVQILSRTLPLDLTGHITALRHDAARLPHPALAAAAHAHADHLTQLADHTVLLSRQFLLVFHEPTPTSPTNTPGTDSGGRPGGARAGRAGRAAEEQLLRRAEEADQLLGATGIRVAALDPDQGLAVLQAATHPDQHLYPPMPPARAPARDHPPGWAQGSAHDSAHGRAGDASRPGSASPPPGWHPPPTTGPFGPVPGGQPGQSAARPGPPPPAAPPRGHVPDPVTVPFGQPAVEPIGAATPGTPPAAEASGHALGRDDEQIEAENLGHHPRARRGGRSAAAHSPTPARGAAAGSGPGEQTPAWSWAPGAQAYIEGAP